MKDRVYSDALDKKKHAHRSYSYALENCLHEYIKSSMKQCQIADLNLLNQESRLRVNNKHDLIDLSVW